ncbi:MAG: M56 family metallopeptidase [Chthoniobacteraceae bacterium]
MNIETHFPALLDLFLKSAALILLGAALFATSRKTSAANRHAIIAAVFAALLLLPLTKLGPSRWSFALEKNAEPSVKVRLPLIAKVETSEKRSTGSSAESAAQPVRPTLLVIPWKTLALSVWLGGAALLLARRGLNVLRLRVVVCRSEKIEDDRLEAMARTLAETSGVRAEIRESALCRVPLVAGVLRPVVLLPLDAKDWSPSLISSALRHELGHIRRRDCITRLLADVVCALYWLNPLVWLAARQMRLAQEQACDNLVLNSGVCADEYAGHLVEVVRGLQGDHFTARHALAMAQPSTLETRVLAIVDTTRDRSPRSVRGTLAGITFAAASLALCTAAQLRGAEGRKAAGEPLTPRALVEVDAKFIEISGEPPGLLDALKLPAPKSVGVRSAVLSAEAMQAAVRALNQKKGVDILSAPRVTLLSKQPAKVEVVREFKYPSEWDKDAKTGKMGPTAFEKRDVGVTLDVTAEVNADGTINLVMTPQVVEFEGYVPFNEAAEKTILKNADGSPVRKTSPGTIERPQDVDSNTNLSEVVGKPDPSKPRKDRMFAGPDAKGMPNDAIWQPVFSTRKVNAEVTVSPGQTVVLRGMDRDDVQTLEDKNPRTGRVRKTEQHIKRRLFVFVTARIVKAEANPPESPAKGADAPADAARKPGLLTAPAPLVIQSDSVTIDKKTRAVQAIGNVKIDTAGAVIRADAANVTPKDAAELYLKEWKVPPGLFQPGTAGSSGKAAAQDSLEKNGITFGEGAVADFRPQNNSLLVRNTQAQLDLVERFIMKESAAAPPVPDAAPAGDAKADVRWIFPKVEFREASVTEIVDFLVAKSKELDPAGKGANIVIRNADKISHISDARVTLSLTNIPLAEVLRYTAALSDCELVREEFAFVIQPQKAGAKPAAPNVLEAKSAAEGAGKPAPPEEVSASMRKAGAIIFPKIDLRDATLSETMDFLREKSKELDPDRKGVNLILKPGAVGQDPRITLSLTNIPLSEALRYFAQLAGFEIVADDHAITLHPPRK